MKKLDKFLSTAKYHILYPIFWILTTTLVFGIWTLVNNIFPSKEPIKQQNMILISIVIGFLFGIYMCLVTYAARKSNAFWAEIKLLEEQLEDVKNIDDLQRFAKKYDEIKLKAMGTGHFNKLKELHSIFESKRRHLNNYKYEIMQ